MLLTTHSGIVVNSDHIACIGLRRHLPSPSEPDPPPGAMPTFRVLLGMADGSFIVAARDLSLTEALFIREDIAHAWETGKTRWKATESRKRFAQGAYFASDEDEQPEDSDSTESEAMDGKLPKIPDL